MIKGFLFFVVFIWFLFSAFRFSSLSFTSLISDMWKRANLLQRIKMDIEEVNPKLVGVCYWIAYVVSLLAAITVVALSIKGISEL